MIPDVLEFVLVMVGSSSVVLAMLDAAGTD